MGISKKAIRYFKTLQYDREEFSGRAFLTGYNLLTLLHEGKYTVREMTEKLGLSDKTIYRLLSLFEEMGICIDKTLDNRYGKYFIAQDNCPLCNQQHITDGEVETK